MSQSNDDDVSTCITIISDEPTQSTEVAPVNNNTGECVASSSTCPKANSDPNQNDPPLNSESVALRLASFEEEEGEQPRDPNEVVQSLEFCIDYPIERYSRKWTRAEVQGLCCLAMEVICLVTLAVFGLQAMGFLRFEDRLPLTFSWKYLWEFFLCGHIPKNLMECLFSGAGGKTVAHEEDTFGGLDNMGPIDVNYILLDEMGPNPAAQGQLLPREKRSFKEHGTPNSVGIPDKHSCEFHEHSSFKWLLNFLISANMMPTINLFTSTILYTSLAVRRRKGLQVLLLLPSFFCFFISVFQQIPISFQYNAAEQSLMKDMHQSIAQSNSPFQVVPIMDETQFHHQCCGVESPDTWERLGKYFYPASCCNSTAFNCSALEIIKRNHVWSVGCLPMERDLVRSFEKWALFLYALKVIAEVGMFCTLSDLTRIEYPPTEVQETSSCEIRDYQVKCRGVMHIKGVTKDGRIVTEIRTFLSWRLIPSRTDLLNGLQLYLKTDQNRIKGSVEVVKRYHAENFLSEDIQIDLSRKNRGIYVFTLR